jgi:RND family efflux transporter MFP subunit
MLWVLLALGLSVAACSSKDPDPAAAPAAKQEPLRPVRTHIVQAQELVGALSLPAEIRPRIETRYGFRLGGKVAQRFVSVGDKVAAGQTLARLDSTDLTPQVNAAQSSLDAAQVDARLAGIELNRLKDLRDKNFVSQSAVDRQQAVHDAARARVEAAQASLRQARNGLEFQVLKAESAGIVTAVEAEAGQVVAAGQSIVRVSRIGDIEALVNIPEPALAQARKVPQWQVVIPSLGQRPLEAKVREIAPVADPASRTFAARLTLQGNLADVQWGMTAIASVPGVQTGQFLVPLTALHTRDQQSRVWILDRATQTVREVKVTTAGFVGDSVRISDGLKAGDEVVTAGANLLIEGQKVKLGMAQPS